MTRAAIIRNLRPFAVAMICMAAPWFVWSALINAGVL